MKKLFLAIMITLLSLPLFAQTSTVTNTAQGQLVTLDIPISLAKSATNYSAQFNLDGYLPNDSTHFFPILWQSDDTVQVTVALQVQNSIAPAGSAYEGSWQTVATATSVQANAGNDTLYVKSIFQRGTIAPGVSDAVSMSGKVGNVGRLVVTFANPTTVGNSGHFRAWVYLPKH